MADQGIPFGNSVPSAPARNEGGFLGRFRNALNNIVEGLSSRLNTAGTSLETGFKSAVENISATGSNLKKTAKFIYKDPAQAAKRGLKHTAVFFSDHLNEAEFDTYPERFAAEAAAKANYLQMDKSLQRSAHHYRLFEEIRHDKPTHYEIQLSPDGWYQLQQITGSGYILPKGAEKDLLRVQKNLLGQTRTRQIATVERTIDKNDMWGDHIMRIPAHELDLLEAAHHASLRTTPGAVMMRKEYETILPEEVWNELRKLSGLYVGSKLSGPHAGNSVRFLFPHTEKLERASGPVDIARGVNGFANANNPDWHKAGNVEVIQHGNNRRSFKLSFPTYESELLETIGEAYRKGMPQVVSNRESVLKKELKVFDRQAAAEHEEIASASKNHWNDLQAIVTRNRQAHADSLRQQETEALAFHGQQQALLEDEQRKIIDLAAKQHRTKNIAAAKAFVETKVAATQEHIASTGWSLASGVVRARTMANDALEAAAGAVHNAISSIHLPSFAKEAKPLAEQSMRSEPAKREMGLLARKLAAFAMIIVSLLPGMGGRANRRSVENAEQVAEKAFVRVVSEMPKRPIISFIAKDAQSVVRAEASAVSKTRPAEIASNATTQMPQALHVNAQPVARPEATTAKTPLPAQASPAPVQDSKVNSQTQSPVEQPVRARASAPQVVNVRAKAEPVRTEQMPEETANLRNMATPQKDSRPAAASSASTIRMRPVEAQTPSAVEDAISQNALPIMQQGLSTPPPPFWPADRITNTRNVSAPGNNTSPASIFADRASLPEIPANAPATATQDIFSMEGVFPLPAAPAPPANMATPLQQHKAPAAFSSALEQPVTTQASPVAAESPIKKTVDEKQSPATSIRVQPESVKPVAVAPATRTDSSTTMPLKNTSSSKPLSTGKSMAFVSGIAASGYTGYKTLHKSFTDKVGSERSETENKQGLAFANVSGVTAALPGAAAQQSFAQNTQRTLPATGTAVQNLA